MDFNWLDIMTYVVTNVIPGLGFGALFGLVLFLITGLIFSELMDWSDKECTIIATKAFVLTTLLGIVVSLVPTHNKVLQTKLSKIKNEAVTRDNINKGVNAIERVLEKLECKHLGCKEEAE